MAFLFVHLLNAFLSHLWRQNIWPTDQQCHVICGGQRHFSNISTSHFTGRSALFCVAHIDFQSQILMAIYQFISLSAWNLVFWLVRQIPTHFEATGSNNDMFDRLQIAIRRASDKRNSQSFKWQCNTSGDYNHFFSFFPFFSFLIWFWLTKESNKLCANDCHNIIHWYWLEIYLRESCLKTKRLQKVSLERVV